MRVLLLAFWDEIGQLFVKNIALIISLIMGTIVKIALDSRGKKLSKLEIFIKIVLSLFMGYMGSLFLKHHGWGRYSDIGVPFITLMGESIITWIMTNFEKIARTVFNSLMPKRDK